MTVKLFSSGDWSDMPQGDTQIKIASGGLTGSDKMEALKVASPEIVDWMSKIATHPDCFYVHKLAMGGSHRYGPNRWGDGFREEVLRRDYPTFELYAKAYRNHDSKGPYYGKVAAARFREDMGCVELITEYYGSPKIAAANGGRVADLELAALQKTGSIPVSMGSNVPGDRCVICHHWSPTRATYCTSKKEGGMCTLFGCKNGMLKVAEDGRLQHVDNPKNTFYDISMVRLGADPCASGLLLPMGKFADFADTMDGHWFMESKLAAWEPEVDVDETIQDAFTNKMIKVAYMLGDMEADLHQRPLDEIDVGLPVSSAVLLPDLHSPLFSKRAQAIKDLALARVFPDFASYAKSAGCTQVQIDEMQPFVPVTFQSLRARRQVPALIKIADFPKKLSTNFWNRLNSCNDLSLEQPTIVRRSLEGAALGKQVSLVQSAKVGSAIPELVCKFAAAKLAWLSEVQSIDLWHLSALQRRDFIKAK